jgi:hypothetical protein
MRTYEEWCNVQDFVRALDEMVEAERCPHCRERMPYHASGCVWGPDRKDEDRPEKGDLP